MRIALAAIIAATLCTAGIAGAAWPTMGGNPMTQPSSDKSPARLPS